MFGLDESNLQAVIHTYDLKDYYYPTLFPVKETGRLDWKMVEAQAGLKIAADLVSRGATIPKKTREALARIRATSLSSLSLAKRGKTSLRSMKYLCFVPPTTLT